MLRLKTILFVCLLVFSTISSARDFYRFSQITRTQGLSSDFIRDITQDSLGFMWFATNNGLCRFDGYTVTSYRENQQQAGGIFNNQIISIYTDKRGGLWVGSISGMLSHYDYKNARFTHYKVASKSELDLGDNVNCMFETKDNRLLIGASDGLYEFDRTTCQTQRIMFQNLHSSFVHVSAIAQDSSGKLYIATVAHGVLQASASLQDFSSLSLVRERKPSGERVQINSVFVDKDARCWVTTENDGLYVISANGTLQAHLLTGANGTSLGSIPLHEIVQDRNGAIWVCSVNGGLWFFDYHSKVLLPEQWLPGMSYTGLTNMSFQPAYLSKDGTLWFGSHGGGVQFCNPSEAVYLHVKPAEAQLPYRIVTSFFEQTNGTLWVGTDGGGLALLDSNLCHLSNIGTRQGLLSNAVLSMQERAGSVWMALWGGGVVEVSQTSHAVLQKFSYRTSDGYSLPNNDIKWVQPGDKLTWIADNGKGLVVYNHDTKQFYHCGNEGYRQIPLRRPEYASKCIKTSDGSIWVASVTGVYRIRGSMYRYDFNQIDSLTPSGVYTQALFEDRQGRVWIGTDHGVDYWSPSDNKFHRLANRFAALSVGAVSIEQDLDGKFWIGNANGLLCLDLVNNKLAQYALPEGFNFTQHASKLLHSGKMVFGGNDGFLLVDPRRMVTHLSAPQVRLTGFSLFYSPQAAVLQNTDTVQIMVANKVSLNYTQSVFGFEFAALDYKSEHATQYSYRLEGFDSTWRSVGKQRLVTFTNLDPGTYRFCVRAVDKGLTSATTAIAISIAPPWWQTWWFRVLLLIFIVLATVTMYRWRIFQVERQKRILEHKVRLRTDELNRANSELLLRKDEIEQQNTQLNELTSTLQHNNHELSHKNEELAALTDELRWQKEALMATNKTLATTNATKDTLFSIIGHDLRNAFHSIQGSAQLLHQSYQQLSEEKRLRMVANIEKASTGVFGTFTNLFDWARSQTNRISFIPELVSLHDLIDELLLANAYLADEKQIKVVKDVPQQAIVLADKKMLMTVLRNLFTNAIKFTRNNGVVSIRVNIIAPMAEIRVSDTGIGIDAESMHRLFEVQATRSTPGTNNETGTGLGLVICREFIERNGGTIQAESQQDKGTSFIVRIPLGNSAERTSSTQRRQAAPLARLTSDAKILIADDDEIILHNLAHILEQAGYEVLQAADGKQAFELCQSLLPNLVISDISMPSLDGFQLCRQIKHTPLTENIPVLLLTANMSNTVQLDSYKSGADAFLEKPYQSDLLLVRVDNLLSRKKQMQGAAMTHTTPNSIKDIKPADAKLMERMQELLYQNIADAEYSVERLADDLGMSRTHLYRKIKQLHGIAPSEFQQNLRLQAAAELLKNSAMRVSEVAYSVGYSDPHYFSTSFVKYFKMSPSEYQRQWRE